MESLDNAQFSSRKHEDLLLAISELNPAKQRLTSPKRRELTLKVSEFDLSHTEKLDADENKLMKTALQKQRLGKDNTLRKTLRFAHQKVKTLNRPLQGPAAARVQRSVGFQNVKKRLNSWNTVVQSNRNAEQLTFPLNQLTISMQTTDDIISNWKSQTQTPLEQQMSAILNLNSSAKKDMAEETDKLNLKELKEYRQEMAKLRAMQSYMAAKAKRQKKIKSKKYHRIVRKESAKKQLKEFETLRKVDPRAALEELEKQEHLRIQERASLRHRNKGKWAVRAKYDIESRKTLVQQLEISRQLTQKNKEGTSSEEEEETNPQDISCDDNPWVGMQAVSKEGKVVSNYRNYWQQKNNAMEKSEGNSSDSLNTKVSDYLNDSKKYAVLKSSSGSWAVSPTTNTREGGDDVISDLSYKMKPSLTTVIRKANHFETSSSLRIDSTATVVDSDEETDELPLRSKTTASVDEELEETCTSMNKDFRANNTNKLFGVLEGRKDEKHENYNVDPSKVITVKPKYLVTQLPDEISNGDEKLDDNSSDEENQINISEAFTEDDVVAEFRKEKDMQEKCQPTDIDLALPGWGEWTGKMKCSRRKKRSFVIKAPKWKPKDFNKGNVVLNEKKDQTVYQHQVNELPLAFTSVKDFEASIRAPIGNTFIPQTAHYKLTAPSVVTRLGTIINPVDEDVLVNNTKLSEIQ